MIIAFIIPSNTPPCCTISNINTINNSRRYISRILMQLMSGTQSEETAVEIVEEKSGSFRMLPALPSSGMDDISSTSVDNNNMFVYYN